jgi:hypothetical protein
MEDSEQCHSSHPSNLGKNKAMVLMAGYVRDLDLKQWISLSPFVDDRCQLLTTEGGGADKDEFEVVFTTLLSTMLLEQLVVILLLERVLSLSVVS